MKLSKLTLVAVALVSMTLIQCGGSSGSNTTSTSASTSTSAGTGSTSTGVQGLKQPVSQSITDAITASNSTTTTFLRTLEQSCTNGGTFGYDGSSYTYTDCDFGGILFNGSISYDTALSQVLYQGFSIVLDGLTMGINGGFGYASVSDGVQITYNNLENSIEEDGGSLFVTTINGELVYNTVEQTIDGAVDYFFDGTTYSCYFNNFDYENATDEEWETACPGGDDD